MVKKTFSDYYCLLKAKLTISHINSLIATFDSTN
jgi:hypothetical protein